MPLGIFLATATTVAQNGFYFVLYILRRITDMLLVIYMTTVRTLSTALTTGQHLL